MESLTIQPILGRKTDVPANDAAMFGEGGLAHDAGGLNFDLFRKKRAVSKAMGYQQWSNSATAQATKCLGLFELYDGSNRDHIIFDNGKVYVYDGALDPANIDAAAPITFANDNVDIYSIIKVGSYMAFADRGEHTPYKWKNGDANLTKLIQAGTEFKFRYLVQFQRRVIGLYSDQTDGSIDIRWSTSFPATAITSMEFEAANQLYIPNDDPITGGAAMGQDRMFIYSENSINQLVYQPDYELPFRIYTVVTDQGCASHQSIVTVGNSHYFFNAGYGFCEYKGGNEFPYGGRPISEDIEKDLQGMNTTYYDLIVGTFIPLNREIVWTVPMLGDVTPDRLVFFNVDTRQWRFEDKAMRYVDNWQANANFTWNNLITELGGTGAVWSDAGDSSWAFYTAARQRLMYANTDGQTYYQTGETLAGAALDGYRIEPILDFGSPETQTLLKEIWFDIDNVGAWSIDVWHRGGDTVGEVCAASWISMPSLSMDSPDRPIVHVMQNARLHQIKWGTNLGAELFQVHSITFKHDTRSTV